jgi:hypothetical protein
MARKACLACDRSAQPLVAASDSHAAAKGLSAAAGPAPATPRWRWHWHGPGWRTRRRRWRARSVARRPRLEMSTTEAQPRPRRGLRYDAFGDVGDIFRPGLAREAPMFSGRMLRQTPNAPEVQALGNGHTFGQRAGCPCLTGKSVIRLAGAAGGGGGGGGGAGAGREGGTGGAGRVAPARPKPHEEVPRSDLRPGPRPRLNTTRRTAC